MEGSGGVEVTLPTEEQILIRRQFDAPKDLVWRAWTEPRLVERWWGGGRGEVTVAEVDLRVGGTWRYVVVAENGFEAAFRGEYREVVPIERIVYTEVYEGAPGAEALNTATFSEEDGRTVLTILVEHKSKEARDAHLASGLEAGMREAMGLLDKVATSLR